MSADGPPRNVLGYPGLASSEAPLEEEQENVREEAGHVSVACEARVACTVALAADLDPCSAAPPELL